MTQERTLKTERLYEGRLVSLRIDTVELPSGRTTKREIVEHVAVVAAVALDSQGNVLLVRQFRKPVERLLLELPAGCVEPKESPDQCIVRELQEETGYLAQKIKRLGSFYISPGFSDELLHLYLATDLQPSPLATALDETIELVRSPLSEIPQLIASGEICDAKSIVGLLWVILSHQEGYDLP